MTVPEIETRENEGEEIINEIISRKFHTTEGNVAQTERSR